MGTGEDTSGGEVRLSLVVPAYQEAERLARSLPRIRDCLSATFPADSVEVIVVDDGSTDGTAQVARTGLTGLPGRVVVLPANRGKGGAIRAGMAAAGGRIRVFLDADLSTPPREIPRLLAAHERGADIVIGTRNHPAAQVEVRQPLLRESMGKVFTFLGNLVVVSGVSDFTCGMKSFTAAAAERVFPPLVEEGWAFDVEVLLRARRAGLRVAEVPVTWRDDRDTRVRRLRDAVVSFAALLRIARLRIR